jgi:hypothetical protein
MDNRLKNLTFRRKFLSTCGAVGSVGLAGCIGGDGDASEQETTTEKPTSELTADVIEGDGDASEQETTTEKPTSELTADVIEGEVFDAFPPRTPTPSSTERYHPWSRISVENPFQQLFSRVEIEGLFRDSGGNIIDKERYYTAILPPETTWTEFSMHSFNSQELSEYEFRIAEQNIGTRGRQIENFDVLNSSIEFDGGSVVTVSGEIELNNSPDTIAVIPLVYDGSGRYRGAFTTTVDNVEPTAVFSWGPLNMYFTPLSEPDPQEFELTVYESPV